MSCSCQALLERIASVHWCGLRGISVNHRINSPQFLSFFITWHEDIKNLCFLRHCLKVSGKWIVIAWGKNRLTREQGRTNRKLYSDVYSGKRSAIEDMGNLKDFSKVVYCKVNLGSPTGVTSWYNYSESENNSFRTRIFGETRNKNRRSTGHYWKKKPFPHTVWPYFFPWTGKDFI